MDWGKIFHPYTNNEPEAKSPEPEPMDKKTAEEALGMDFDYTKEQLDQKYREAVADGMNKKLSIEEMEAIDAAKSSLDGCFVEGVESVVTSSAKPEPKKPAMSDSEFVSTFSKSGKWAQEQIFAPSMVFMYHDAHARACKALHKSSTCDYPAPKRSPKPPLWYRFVYSLLGAPIWRILFIVAVVAFGMSEIDMSMDDPMSDAIEIVFEWGGLVILMVWNTVFGTFTNLLRVGISIAARKLLELHLFIQELAALKTAITKGETSESYDCTALGIREE